MRYIITFAFVVAAIAAHSARFIALDLLVAYIPMAWMAIRIGRTAGTKT